MNKAQQFVNEVVENEAKGKLGLELFHDTLLKYKGTRDEIDFEFEDGSRAYFCSYKDEWIINDE